MPHCTRTTWLVVFFVFLAAPQSGTPVLAQEAPTLRLSAGEHFPLQFTFITSVRELGDGRVIVADQREGRLALLDWSDGSASDLAGVGAGPREYGRVGYLYALSGDSTVLTDLQHRRWLLLSGPQPVGTLPSTSPGPHILGSAFLGGADLRGHVLGAAPIIREGGPSLASTFPDSLHVIVLDREGGVADSIARVGGRGSAGIERSSRGGMVSIGVGVLATEDRPVLFPDGWIAIVRAWPYRVDWRSPAGVWQPSPDLPFEMERASEDDVCAALVQRGGSAANCVEPSPAEGEMLPPFIWGREEYVFALPSGRVAVRRLQTARAQTSRYDIIDRQGALSAVMEVALAERIVGFGPAHVYTVIKDPDTDLESIVRYPWPPDA